MYRCVYNVCIFRRSRKHVEGARTARMVYVHTHARTLYVMQVVVVCAPTLHGIWWVDPRIMSSGQARTGRGPRSVRETDNARAPGNPVQRLHTIRVSANVQYIALRLCARTTRRLSDLTRRASIASRAGPIKWFSVLVVVPPTQCTGRSRRRLLCPRIPSLLCDVRVLFWNTACCVRILGIRYIVLHDMHTCIEHVRKCDQIWKNAGFPIC